MILAVVEPVELVAVTVCERLWVTDGFPVIAQVFVLKFNPVGNAGDIEQELTDPL